MKVMVAARRKMAAYHDRTAESGAIEMKLGVDGVANKACGM
jgi:hypothetical protein